MSAIKVSLYLLLACSNVTASRYGLLRSGTSSNQAPLLSTKESSRSLIEEDFQVVYRQLFGYRSSSGNANLSMAAGLSMAGLSMAPLVGPSMMAELSMAQLDASIHSSEPSLQSNGHSTDSTTTNTEFTTTNAADGRDRLSFGLTGGLGALAGLALVVVATVTYQMVRRTRSLFAWKHVDGDDSSLSSLPTTVYVGNGNCGTF